MGRCSSSFSLVFTILSALPLITIIVLCGATLQIKPVAVEALPLYTNARGILDEGPAIPEAKPYKVILHPLTGLCVLRKLQADPLRLGDCSNSDGWEYTPQDILSIKGTYLCLQADGEGNPAKLGIICSGPNSRWELISDSETQLSSKISDGSSVCLDVDANNIIVTNTCNCLNTDDTCDPASQWFKLVDRATS